MTHTFATLFSGGELAGVGMRDAGLSHLWGIEHESAIADVARANGFGGTITADVLDVDPQTLPVPYALHASPVCTRASRANGRAREAPLDVALGEKIAHFVDVLRPRIFTLENVWGYVRFEAFQRILAALMRSGYMFHFQHLNAADFGVPQTRQRLVLRAVRDRLLPNLPPPVAWRGWYQAVEDLLPGLPDSKFARWQMERLPAEITGPILLAGSGNTNLADAAPGLGVRTSRMPAHTVHASRGGVNPRAFLFSNQKSHDHKGNEYDLRYRTDNQPAMTVRASPKPSAYRALLVSGSNSTYSPTRGERNILMRSDAQPSYTITAGGGRGRNVERAWLSGGRVVMMNARALARFQTAPDSYLLPASPQLARLVIGNGVPCLLAETLYRGLLP